MANEALLAFLRSNDDRTAAPEAARAVLHERLDKVLGRVVYNADEWLLREPLAEASDAELAVMVATLVRANAFVQAELDARLAMAVVAEIEPEVDCS